MDWDDLRYVLEVTRTGSALGAGKALGVNQTTVMRRIAALEAKAAPHVRALTDVLAAHVVSQRPRLAPSA